VSRNDDILRPLDAAARQKQLLIRIIRVLFLAIFSTFTLLTVLQVDASSGKREIAFALGWPFTIGIALSMAVVVIMVDVLTPTKKISTLFSVLLGLLAAILATVATGFIIDLVVKAYDIQSTERIVGAVKVLLGIALSYLAITTILQTQDDFRLVIPYVEFAKQIRGTRPLVIDSSALIDARLVDLAQTGLLQSPIVIPKFVIAELQLLADSPDKSRRGKGRRGLEVVQRLQRSPGLDVTIDQTPIPGKAVDQMLIELARTMPGLILTTDAPLTKLAKIQGVAVVNMHDIQAAMKPAVIPGEPLTLRLVKPGEQPGQGVGFLDDGTMVVAEDGGPYIGREVMLVVVSTLQTAAGRMVFARTARRDEESPSHHAAAPSHSHAPAAVVRAEVEENDNHQSDAHESTEPEAPGVPEAPVANAHDPASSSADDATPERAPGDLTPDHTSPDSPSPTPDAPRPQGPFPPKRPDPRRSGIRNPRR
jgi:uncharacterized protein YacL